MDDFSLSDHAEQSGFGASIDHPIEFDLKILPLNLVWFSTRRT